MKKFLPLFFMACAACPAMVAGEASIWTIRANMGGVDFSGLPRRIFTMLDNAELAQLGFVFLLIHRASTDCAGARSEWLTTGTHTCVYADLRGNLVWLKPDGQEIVIRKSPPDGRAADGSRIRSIDGENVTIEDGAGNLWTYHEGFIVSVESPHFGKFAFKTDREAILSISKSGDGGNEGAGKVLLSISYSETGEIRALKCPDSGECVLSRDSRHRLVSIARDAGPSITLEYDNLLLTRWRSTDGTGDVYAWETPANIPERIDLGAPPVVLKRDGSFVYEYEHPAGARIIRVRTPDNKLVSETRISVRGIRQKTRSGEILEFPFN